MDECLRAVEDAFASYARGKTFEPGLLHVEASGGEFHVKAGGFVAKRSYFSAKVGGGFFRNRADLGLPNIVGLLLLADGSSGVPLSVMESGQITRLRTGAATGVAAKYLARPEASTVTLCGAGAQAETQLRALMSVLPLRRAFIWTRGDPKAAAGRLAQSVSIEIHPEPNLKRATLQSDVIVTCTPSRTWFLGRGHVRPGTFIAAVGADAPNKQELEPELLANSSVVCDLRSQSERVGELHHAIVAGVVSQMTVRGGLAEIIVGTAPKRLSDEEIIIFDSTGTALQDTAAAVAIYEKAVSLGRGSGFSFWK